MINFIPAFWMVRIRFYSLILIRWFLYSFTPSEIGLEAKWYGSLITSIHWFSIIIKRLHRPNAVTTWCAAAYGWSSTHWLMWEMNAERRNEKTQGWLNKAALSLSNPQHSPHVFSLASAVLLGFVSNQYNSASLGHFYPDTSNWLTYRQCLSVFNPDYWGAAGNNYVASDDNNHFGHRNLDSE